jgi:hypothetical protein
MTYSAKDQALIDRIEAEHEAQSGQSRLWGWFGLSRAAWLTLPRVLMHEMPDDWQKQMAVLMERFDAEFPEWTEQHLFVTAKRKGKFEALPEVLCNYRHPNRADIDALRSSRPNS